MKKMIAGISVGIVMVLLTPITATAFEHHESKTQVSEGAEVYILSPVDGATVKGPVHVKMGHKGVRIQAAGEEAHNAGHHVLLIDTPMPALDEDIPFDDQHRHLADGAGEVILDLAPGTHTLQLLLVDHNHAVHARPVMSEMPITIHVE